MGIDYKIYITIPGAHRYAPIQHLYVYAYVHCHYVSVLQEEPQLNRF